MGRFRNINEDAKKFLGIPPYDDEANTYYNLADFAIDCVKFWGADAFNEKIEEHQNKNSFET